MKSLVVVSFVVLVALLFLWEPVSSKSTTMPQSLLFQQLNPKGKKRVKPVSKHELFARSKIQEFRAMKSKLSGSVRQLKENQWKNQVKQFYAQNPIPENGDFTCTICVVVIKIAENEAEDNKDLIKKTLEKLCNLLPPNMNGTCHLFIEAFGGQIIDQILQKQTPSKICNALGMFHCNGCSMDNNNILLQGVQVNSKQEQIRLEVSALVLSYWLQHMKDSNLATNPVVPLLDVDSDLVSPTHDLVRGCDWRGCDCDDRDPTIRPGVLNEYSSNFNTDMNCNGIYGINSQTQNGYEKELCSNSADSDKMIVMFGDSASSSFHIPPEYLHLQNISSIFRVLDDEFDYPEHSWSTGYDDTINGESVYLHMRDYNRCNHRSFQNVGHNGHKMVHLANTQIPAINWTSSSKPVLGFIAYIGNDVCKDQLSEMTTPQDFANQLTQGLNKLDTLVAPNSKIIVTGLVDGRILWNEMSTKIHPLGVPYENVYRFLSCTGANPCQTWLTSNETMRNATSQRAYDLGQAAKKVIEQTKGTFKNIEVNFVDFPLPYAIQYAKDHGFSPSLLIEAFDGFHPSQVGHRIFSQYFWNEVFAKLYPGLIGKSNPNNAKIAQLFQDQGGY